MKREKKEQECRKNAKTYLKPKEQSDTMHTFKYEGIKNAAQCIKTTTPKNQRRLACKVASEKSLINC